MNTCLEYINKISEILFLKMNFKNSKEFEKEYILILLHRAKLFNFGVLLLSFYSFYADVVLLKNIDNLLYRKTLMVIHVITFLLAIVYIGIYILLERMEQYRNSTTAKIIMISDVFLTVFLAACTSLNSQRFTCNIDIYLLSVLMVALIVPMYPKVMFWNYIINHTFFVVGLSFFSKDSGRTIINRLNSTITVAAAMMLFIVFYRNHVINFLNKEKLKEDELTFRKLFEMNPFPLVVSRFEDGKILDANHKALVFYEIPEGRFKGLNYNDLYTNTLDRVEILEKLEKVKMIHDYVVEHKTISGQSKWVIVNYELIDYLGEKSILSAIADITEIKRLENELSVYASMDVLTGVLNRRVGMEIIKKKLYMSKITNKEFAVCFVDVDNLKMVNDQFGHHEGDCLITEICKVINEQVQSEDVIFRYGGDEFIVLFNSKSEYEIDEICNKIKVKFEEMNKNQHKSYPIHASLGVFLYKPEMDLNVEQIIELADKEMYENKFNRKKALLVH